MKCQGIIHKPGTDTVAHVDCHAEAIWMIILNFPNLQAPFNEVPFSMCSEHKKTADEIMVPMCNEFIATGLPVTIEYMPIL